MLKKAKQKASVVEEFIEIVKEQLEIQQITRSELARDAGVGRAYLYRVLDGIQTPSFDWAEKVANTLGISIEFKKCKT